MNVLLRVIEITASGPITTSIFSHAIPDRTRDLASAVLGNWQQETIAEAATPFRESIKFATGKLPYRQDAQVGLRPEIAKTRWGT